MRPHSATSFLKRPLRCPALTFTALFLPPAPQMFAPLIRDGRMEKFYWCPENEDLVSILLQMYKDDGLQASDMQELINRFR